MRIRKNPAREFEPIPEDSPSGEEIPSSSSNGLSILRPDSGGSGSGISLNVSDSTLVSGGARRSPRLKEWEARLEETRSDYEFKLATLQKKANGSDERVKILELKLELLKAVSLLYPFCPWKLY
jgi:hypothetical protein